MDQKTFTIDNFLSKDDTKVMKAIAICCMLIHHLWCFPTRIPGGTLTNLFTIFGLPSTTFFGFFGKICVPMFFFFGGYGVYKSYFGRKYDIVEKLKKLYFAYWKVFLIFIPIGFIFFANQKPSCSEVFIYTRFLKFDLKELIANFVAFTSSYNREWWFLLSYAFALISFPFIRAVIDRFSTRANIFIAIVITILVSTIFPGISKVQGLGPLNTNFLYVKFFCQIAPYASCFWMGAVVARNGLLDRLNDSLKTNHLLNPITDIAAWCVVIFLRQAQIGDTFDIFYIPVLTVTAMDLINRVKFVRFGAIVLGKQSTNMWLVHTFFCYYFGAVAKIVAAPRYASVSILILIAFSFVAGVLVDLFWKGVGLLFERVKKQVKKLFCRKKKEAQEA